MKNTLKRGSTEARRASMRPFQNPIYPSLAIGLILANHPFQKVKWGVHLLHLRESPSELRRYASCTAKRKARLEDAAANVSLYAYSSFSEVLALAVSEVPT